jgi:DNA-binding MarR family transcriptional regulator
MMHTCGANESACRCSQLRVSDLFAMLRPLSFAAFPDARREEAMPLVDVAVLLAMMDGGRSCGEIAGAAGVATTDFVRSCARLAARGFVAPIDDADTASPGLTEAGRAAARYVATSSAEGMESVVGALSPDERAALAAALATLSGAWGTPPERRAVAW